jgi:hypothetical protein
MMRVTGARAILAGVAAAVAPLALAAGLTTASAAPAARIHGALIGGSCAEPARLADGQYSSYRTAGTMPSGVTVRLSDGDLWSCRHGAVYVHTTRENRS